MTKHPLHMIARLGWQPMVVALAMALEGFVNTVVVAHIGLSALASVAVAGNICLIQLCVYGAVGLATKYYTSRAKDKKEAGMYIIQGAFLSSFLSLLLGGVTIALAAVLFRLYGVENNADGVLYLQIVGGMCILPALSGAISGGLAGLQEQKSTTQAGLAKSFIHLVLDCALIYPQHLGLIWVAWAAVLSSLLQTGWIIMMFFLRQAGIDLKWKKDWKLQKEMLSQAFRLLRQAGTDLKWKVDWKLQKEMLSQAFQLMLGGLSNQIVMWYFFAKLAKTGPGSLEAMRIADVVKEVFYNTWLWGVFSSISSVVGPMAEKKEQVARYIRWALGIVAIGTVVSAAIQLTLGKVVVGLFTNDPTVAKMAIWVILLYAWVNGLWGLYSCVAEMLGAWKQIKTASTIVTLSSMLLLIGCWLASPSLVALCYAEAVQYLFVGTVSVAYLCGFFKSAGIELFPVREAIVRRSSLLKTRRGRDDKAQVNIQYATSLMTLSQCKNFVNYPEMKPVFTALQAHRALTLLASAKKGPVENLPVGDAVDTVKRVLSDALAVIGKDKKLQEYLERKTGAHWEDQDPQVFFTALVLDADKRAKPLETRTAVQQQLFEVQQFALPEVNLRMAEKVCAEANQRSMVAA